MKSVKKVLARRARDRCHRNRAGGRIAGQCRDPGGGRPVNYEWIDGFLAGKGALANAPVVPLKLCGAVNTRGSINLGGNQSVGPIGRVRAP